MRKFWVTDATVSGTVVFNSIIVASSTLEARRLAREMVATVEGYDGLGSFEVTEEPSINPIYMLCRSTGCTKYTINGRWSAGSFDNNGNFVTNDGKHVALKEDNIGHEQFPVTEILPEETKKEEIRMNIEITPAIMQAAQTVQTMEMDYWPQDASLGLPEGVTLYSYEDGVWLVRHNDSCNMDDATKIICVLPAPLKTFIVSVNGSEEFKSNDYLEAKKSYDGLVFASVSHVKSRFVDAEVTLISDCEGNMELIAYNV
jgi:hypothetical protein